MKIRQSSRLALQGRSSRQLVPSRRFFGKRCQRDIPGEYVPRVTSTQTTKLAMARNPTVDATILCIRSGFAVSQAEAIASHAGRKTTASQRMLAEGDVSRFPTPLLSAAA